MTGAARALENSVEYFTYIGTRSQGMRDYANEITVPVDTPAQPRRNECTSASFGVMRLAGSRARHLSSKSTNDVRSLRSSSFICADEGGMSLARKSRVGFDMCTLRTTSWNNPMSNYRDPIRRTQGSSLTAPVTLSFSMLSKPPISSK